MEPPQPYPRLDSEIVADVMAEMDQWEKTHPRPGADAGIRVGLWEAMYDTKRETLLRLQRAEVFGANPDDESLERNFPNPGREPLAELQGASGSNERG